MTRSMIFLLAAAVSIGAAGCQSAASSNANSNSNSARTTAGVIPPTADATNTPPGTSASPIQPSANSTPGIPAANGPRELPKGATPTPGIPDPKTLGKPFKPGATPTPGIPDPETIRKQMSGQMPIGNVNAAPPGNNQMRPMKKGMNQPRPANKPAQ